MSEFEKSYASGMMNEQQFNQLSQALYNYCKVMSVPKLVVHKRLSNGKVADHHPPAVFSKERVKPF